MDITNLKKEYDFKKEKIKQRLKDFEEVFNKDNKEIFEELCFCILTPNASARMGINAMISLKPILYTGNLQDIQNALKKYLTQEKTSPSNIDKATNWVSEKLPGNK